MCPDVPEDQDAENGDRQRDPARGRNQTDSE